MARYIIFIYLKVNHLEKIRNKFSSKCNVYIVCIVMTNDELSSSYLFVH